MAWHYIRIGIVLVLVAVTVFLCIRLTPELGQSTASVKMELPSSLAGYTGEDDVATESERALLPKDTEFAKKTYTDAVGDMVYCQIVLAGAEKRSIHRPEACLPGQGWSVNSSRVVPISLEGGGELRVMQLVITRPVQGNDGRVRTLTGLFYYWFVGEKITTPHHLVRLLTTYRDTLFYNVNHRWAYMIVSGSVFEGFKLGGKSFDETQKQLESFIALMAPQIIPAEALGTTK